MSRDPGLLKALEVAKRLGRRQPPHLVWRPRQPQLDLAPARVRRLTNPRAGAVSCSAAVYRNLAGYGSGTGQQLGQYFSTCMIPFIFESIIPESLSQVSEPSKTFNFCCRHLDQPEAAGGAHHEEGAGRGLHAGGAGRDLHQVSCGWWRTGHVTSCSPLIGPRQPVRARPPPAGRLLRERRVRRGGRHVGAGHAAAVAAGRRWAHVARDT